MRALIGSVRYVTAVATINYRSTGWLVIRATGLKRHWQVVHSILFSVPVLRFLGDIYERTYPTVLPKNRFSSFIR
jgi:hypothetical protein